MSVKELTLVSTAKGDSDTSVTAQLSTSTSNFIAFSVLSYVMSCIFLALAR